MLADDTKRYVALTDVVNSPISLKEDLAKLQDWSTTMQLKIHLTNVMFSISNTQTNTIRTLIAETGTCRLNAVTSKKGLGITIDRQLFYTQRTVSRRVIEC